MIFTFIMVSTTLKINVRENRRRDLEWAFQRHWQHWTHKTQDGKNTKK